MIDLNRFIRWPLVRREIEEIKNKFEREFGVVIRINESELNRVFKKWRKNIVEDYLDLIDEPTEIEERRIIEIAMELACYDLVVSSALEFDRPASRDERLDANFQADTDFFRRMIQDHARVTFPLYYVAHRLERLVRDVDPNLTIRPRFQQQYFFELEYAVEVIEAEPIKATWVLDWLDLRSLIDIVVRTGNGPDTEAQS